MQSVVYPSLNDIEAASQKKRKKEKRIDIEAIHGSLV